jgi:pimeloyl-ACP methyl ester carboxylesterase
MGKKRTQLEMDGIESGFVCLSTKPTARLSYSFIPQPSGHTGRHSKRLLVFLSGIDNSQTIWQGTLTKLVSLSRTNGFDLPPMLAYDRYGAGNSDHDPSDAGKPPEQYHDAVESMRDLHQLIIQIAPKHLGLAENELHELRIIFCAYSIGCCIARFYADAYPGTVEALLLIDSPPAGTAAENLVPDPDIPEEWEKGRLFLPEGTTADQCRDAIRKGRNSPLSGHAMTTRERIRWDNMPQLLPSSERPKLRGPEPGMPLVAVVNSDAEVAFSSFANVSICLF